VPGLKSILTILGCQPDSVLPPSSSRRRSSAVRREDSDVPLQRYKSPPAEGGLEGSALADDASDSTAGRAVWFSTREETLSESKAERIY
jgi:hypothetical protein